MYMYMYVHICKVCICKVNVPTVVGEYTCVRAHAREMGALLSNGKCTRDTCLSEKQITSTPYMKS